MNDQNDKTTYQTAYQLFQTRAISAHTLEEIENALGFNRWTYPQDGGEPIANKRYIIYVVFTDAWPGHLTSARYTVGAQDRATAIEIARARIVQAEPSYQPYVIRSTQETEMPSFRELIPNS